MGLQIRTYVEGKQRYLDLYGNETIDIEVSFAEIQDITKKNSAFTKEFRVPGSKNNNEIFNYFFDINSVYLDWNPKKKFEADLLYDGFELYNGYVRMNSVSINKTEKIYSVSFYNAVGDVVANIGDKSLCEVDTTPVNYFLSGLTDNSFWIDDPSFQNVSVPIAWSGGTDWFGLTNDNPLVNGDVNLMLGQRGYDYTGSSFNDIRDIDTGNTPILEFSGVPGFFDYYSPVEQYPNAVNLAYLIPNLRVRKLYELIMKDAGYSIDSEFFATDYFGRQYLPLSFNTESVYLSQSKDYQFQFFNSTGTTMGYSGDTFITHPIAIDGGSTSFLDVVFPIDIVYENLGYNPAFPPSDPAVDGYNYAFFRVPQGQYKLALDFTTECISNPNGDVTPIGLGDVNALVIIGTSGGYFATTSTPCSFQIYGIGDTIGSQYVNSFTSTTFSSLGLYNGYDYLCVAFTPQTDFKIIDVRLTVIGESQALPLYIRLNEEMSCEIKQIDFIQNINKMFNLVVVEHPIKPNTLIVEPMIDYIGKGEVLDWTSKVDWDSSITLTPTSSIINGSIFLANKMDKDFINTQFNSRSNLIFGQNIINLGEDYKNAQTNLTQTLGQNTDYYLNASGTTNPALSCYFITKQNNSNGKVGFEFRPFRSLPRVAFRGFPLTNNAIGQASWYVRFGGDAFPIAYYQNYNRLTTYPFALEGFSHYLTYNSTDTFTPDELIYPEVMTQYDMFYRDYIEDLIAPENKIMSCKMYLTPWEVSQLYYNEKIIIKNAYWRINKISGLSLIEPGLCNVELVKLTRDYTPFPIRFYDLIPCDCNAEVIHTNTDLIYHIYAFEGQYVSVVLPPFTFNSFGEFENTQSYKVVEVEFNENYEYTTPYLNGNLGNTASNRQGQYPYFAGSGCTVETRFPTYFASPYNEFVETGITNCDTYQITNTGNSRSTFYFENCSGTTSSWTLDPDETFDVCMNYGNFTGDTFTICINQDVVDCEVATPLPTPTPTLTPGLSPTPTATPPATQSTPTPTPTPSSTRTLNCGRLIQILITDNGWLKYTTCDGSVNYEYVTTAMSPLTFGLCVIQGSILPGFPYADLASFEILSTGTPC
jgi:hypothetical protein